MCHRIKYLMYGNEGYNLLNFINNTSVRSLFFGVKTLKNGIASKNEFCRRLSHLTANQN